MRITIRTVGNRSLYTSLAESYDSETVHRTATGAAIRLIKIRRDARKWAQAVGSWGTVKIDIDGKPVDDMDMTGILAYADEAAHGTQWERDDAKRRLIAVLSV